MRSSVRPSEAPATPLRLRHVDSLRAVAALLVIWTHFAETLQRVSTDAAPGLGFLFTLPSAMNFGRLGVMIFFAISGFVICRSFNGPRAGGARRFLIRRACRLYPAFWASMVGGAFAWWLLGKTLTLPLLAANATMLPALFGQPDLIGVYWTLEVELLFYALCLGLYLLDGLDSLRVLGGLSVAAALLPRVVHKAVLPFGHHYHLPDIATSWCISLAVMFWGAAFRLVYDATGGFRHRPFARWDAWFVVLLVPVVADLFDPDFKHLLAAGRFDTLLREAGFVLAMGVFAAWIAAGRIDFQPLTFLGVISYSLYLFHPLVMYGVLRGAEAAQRGGWLAPGPLWAAMAVSGALTVGLCALTYRWVEQPAIALGKRWVNRTKTAAIPGGFAPAE